MNKLYTINWLLPNGYVISTCSFWSKEAMTEYMKKNPEWRFRMKEDNDCHMIYEAY